MKHTKYGSKTGTSNRFKTLASGALLGAAACLPCSGQAQGNQDAGQLKYNAKEWSADIYGGIATPSGGGWSGSSGTGGLGVNYFFLRNLGVGLDASFFSAEAQDQNGTKLGSINLYPISGNIILRLPIHDTGFSPYISGGVGYTFVSGSGSGNGNMTYGIGAGLEYRFTRHISTFIDDRFNFLGNKSDGDPNTLNQFRIGFRYVF